MRVQSSGFRQLGLAAEGCVGGAEQMAVAAAWIKYGSGVLLVATRTSLLVSSSGCSLEFLLEVMS